MYEKYKIVIFIASLLLLAGAIGYVAYGSRSKCGGFEGKFCPRGFRCDLSERPGFVVRGELDSCSVRIGKGEESLYNIEQ